MASASVELFRSTLPRSLGTLLAAVAWYARHLGRPAAAGGWRFARSAEPSELRAAGAPRRLLVVGDSAAVGLGAGRVEESIIGRLSRTFPGLSIESRAACGARAACVVEQLQKAPGGYDAILIAAGGNDVIRGTSDEDLERSLSTAIDLARKRSSVVIVANSANVGGAPMFAWPLNAILSRRSLRARRVFSKVCAHRRVEFVNFTFEPERDPFLREQERYYSDDGLHPTGDAYAWCFDVLIKQSRLSRLLAGGEPAALAAAVD